MTKAPALHLCGAYGLAGRRLFAPLDLWLPAGKWTCILGPSGIGKSTLLRLIAGLECGGTWSGQISASDDQALDGRISFMAQSDLLLPWLSVLENTVLGARLRGQTPEHAKAQHLLEQVGLAAHQRKKPAELSGGMRQRVALVRSLMEDRPVALLDEPFSALDASTRADMQDLSARMLKGKTVLMVTHDPAEAVRLGDQIIVLTQQGAKQWPVPDSAPVRDQFSADTIACQAALLTHLREL